MSEWHCAECGQDVAINEQHSFVDCALSVADRNSDNYTKVLTAAEYCAKFYEWFPLAQHSDTAALDADALIKARLAIEKSCLLDRLIHCGESGPSQTPCPVHAGRWSGRHSGWPGQMWTYLVDDDQHKKGDQWPAEEQPILRAWHDQGCRCYQHRCGCTTGWQPDEHCGCNVDD